MVPLLKTEDPVRTRTPIPFVPVITPPSSLLMMAPSPALIPSVVPVMVERFWFVTLTAFPALMPLSLPEMLPPEIGLAKISKLVSLWMNPLSSILTPLLTPLMLPLLVILTSVRPWTPSDAAPLVPLIVPPTRLLTEPPSVVKRIASLGPEISPRGNFSFR
jgi:hypothetical protein